MDGPSSPTHSSMPSPTPESQPSFEGLTPKEQRDAFRASRLRWIQEQREKSEKEECRPES